MATITEWLASLGMPEYARRFTENNIDVSVLRHLTDQDLKELGISLGHRRKMLAAIAELADAAPVRPLPAAPPESRFEALHTSGLITLVGREEESELMLRRWSRPVKVRWS